MGFLDKAKEAAASAASTASNAASSVAESDMGQAMKQANEKREENRKARYEERLASINEFLKEDEEMVEVFEPKGMFGRDFAVFTDKRMIWVNVQGLSGKQIGYTNLPYSKVSTFAVRTAGLLDFDCELCIAFSGNIADFDGKANNGQFVLSVPAKSDVKKLCKIVSSYIL